MPDPSNSYVTDATFNGGKITLTVRVDSFTAGDYVEISGHATQSSGAFANYYSIEEVPADPADPASPATPADAATPASPATPAGTAAPPAVYTPKTVTVTADPVPPQRFLPSEDITVVVRVAKVWVTVLGGQNQSRAKGSKPAETPPDTHWNIIRQVTDMKGNFDYSS